MDLEMLPEFAQETIAAFQSAANTGLQEAISEFSAPAEGETAEVEIPAFDFTGFAGASIDTQESLISAGIENVSASLPTSGTENGDYSFDFSNPDIEFQPAEGSSGGEVKLTIGSQTLNFTVGGNAFTGDSNSFGGSIPSFSAGSDPNSFSSNFSGGSSSMGGFGGGFGG